MIYWYCHTDKMEPYDSYYKCTVCGATYVEQRKRKGEKRNKLGRLKVRR